MGGEILVKTRDLTSIERGVSVAYPLLTGLPLFFPTVFSFDNKIHNSK
jgi:hypothetical protein